MYDLAFELRAADGDAVWRWQPADPLHHADPLTPLLITFREPRLAVEQPRHQLTLLAGDDEIARQPLLVGPAAVFQG